MSSWLPKTKVLIIVKSQIWNVSQKQLFCIVSRLFLQCFFHDFLKKRNFISNSAYTLWNLYSWHILVSWKALSLLKVILKVTDIWQTAKFGVFPKLLFSILVSNSKLGAISCSSWSKILFTDSFYFFSQKGVHFFAFATHFKK